MSRIELYPLQGPVEATVEIPGSKSYTNRALLMAALSPQPVLIKKPLVSDDTKAMISCLKEFGIRCTSDGNDIEVPGNIADVADRTYELDANLSGTTIRFILALACIVPGTKILKGKEGLNKRPIRDLALGLRQLGAEIEYLEKEGFPPLKVSSSTLHPGVVHMKGDVSSQYFSAILMIAPLIGEVTVEVEGEQISKPYIDMTIDTMKRFGAQITNENYKRYTILFKQPYGATEYVVEGDASSASYFAAIAALTKSRITLTNMNSQSVQADMRFLSILESMGSTVSYNKDSITVEGGGVRPIEVDMEHCPDQAQTLAVLAAFAPGVTKITGVQSLRIKETERIKALEQELAKMGIETSSTHDSLTIHGGNPKSAIIDTYGDHRMAMSFAVAGTALAGMEIHDPEVVGKTFPSFWEKLASIGVGIEKNG